MPSRRRPKSPSAPSNAGVAPSGKGSGNASAAGSSTGRDPAEMFAAAVKESAAIDAAKREKEQRQQAEAAARAAEKAAKADAMKAAQRDLDRAIAAVRDAKAAGRSTVEADAAWKAAKARVIELETGTAPAWAPRPAATEPADADGFSDADDAGDAADGSPVDGDPVGEEAS